MNAALKPPPELTSSGVRPADRLGFTLFVAALVHVAIIFGIIFTPPPPAEIRKTLEITLSTFKSQEKPKEADFLAQDNQQGSGTLEHKAAPKTTEQAPFQDSKVNKVTPAAAPQPTQRKEAAVAKTALTTTKQQQQKAATKRKEEEAQPDAQPAPVFDRTQLSSEIATLTAELAQEQQEYAKRPRVNRQHSASTARDISAWYRDEWRKKIERIGNLNYPDEARRQRIYGNLRLAVTVKSDGTVVELLVLESSGHPVLDEAAKKIVRLSAPFAPFTGELAQKYDQVEIIRTWRFERGDRLSSN
ncbi:TonB family protein [Aquipseudomonas alcaligenes]|uniref:TonB family protein n=1 Tax=Aquipseudomonas alcaligenes TaxID=43263 RepID=UPI003747908C